MNLAIGSCKVTTTVSSDNALSIIHSSSDCQLWRVPNSNDGTIFIYHFLWVSRSFFFRCMNLAGWLCATPFWTSKLGGSHMDWWCAHYPIYQNTMRNMGMVDPFALLTKIRLVSGDSIWKIYEDVWASLPHVMPHNLASFKLHKSTSKRNTWQSWGLQSLALLQLVPP